MLSGLPSPLWGLLLLSVLGALLLFALIRGGRGPVLDGHDPFVIDGDTIVSDRVRIRLHGIDAPELSQTGGAEARTHLIRLIAGGAVRIEPTGKDKYGRVVARVYACSGDLGQLMVRDGYACAAYGRDYAAEERAARRSRAGLWAGSGISSPSAHRARSAGDVKKRKVSKWT